MKIENYDVDINLPKGLSLDENDSIKNHLQQWYNLIKNQPIEKELNEWKTIPQLPNYRFKNLKVVNDENCSANCNDISVNFTYDLIEEI